MYILEGNLVGNWNFMSALFGERNSNFFLPSGTNLANVLTGSVGHAPNWLDFLRDKSSDWQGKQNYTSQHFKKSTKPNRIKKQNKHMDITFSIWTTTIIILRIPFFRMLQLLEKNLPFVCSSTSQCVSFSSFSPLCSKSTKFCFYQTNKLSCLAFVDSKARPASTE